MTQRADAAPPPAAHWLARVLRPFAVVEPSEAISVTLLTLTVFTLLFLVGTRAEKHLGETVIDTFVVRMGDVFSALLVSGTGVLHLPSRTFALVNLALVICWLLSVFGLGREQARRSRGVSPECSWGVLSGAPGSPRCAGADKAFSLARARRSIRRCPHPQRRHGCKGL